MPKLRSDQRAANADVAVIVTEALPKGIEYFDEKDRVCITATTCVLPVAAQLRERLLCVAAARRTSEGQVTKQEMLYDYAIRDPSQVDHRGHPDGPRFYVGQSKQLGLRADANMKEGGRATSGGSQKASRIYKIMKQGLLPKFEILESTPTHLRSLISETLWARRSNWLGYNLENKWAEHQGAEAPNGLRSVPRERTLEFTVAEALEDGLSVMLRCKPCGLHANVHLERLRPEVLLKHIRVRASLVQSRTTGRAATFAAARSIRCMT